MTSEQAIHEVRKGFRHLISQGMLEVDQKSEVLHIEGNGAWVPVFIWIGEKEDNGD